MEQALERLLRKARELLPATTGYRREKLSAAIFEAERIMADLRDLEKPRQPINNRIVMVIIELGEGGLYD